MAAIVRILNLVKHKKKSQGTVYVTHVLEYISDWLWSEGLAHPQELWTLAQIAVVVTESRSPIIRIKVI